MTSRRTLIRSAVQLAAAGFGSTVVSALSPTPAAAQRSAAARRGPRDEFHGLCVGVASYSLRNFPLDKALQATHRMGIRYLSLKDVHLPVDSSAEKIGDARKRAADLGITITSCGVLYLKDNDANMKQAFDYTHALGATVAVIGVSRQMLPRLNRIIADYPLKAAIHNHGPGDKLFPSPLEVYRSVQPLRQQIGLCMDLGHTFRMHENLVDDIRRTQSRLYSMHFKDLESAEVKAEGVPVGMGVMPIIAVLRELLTFGYKGEVQLEYEVEADDPVPGMEESFGFMRGVLQTV